MSRKGQAFVEQRITQDGDPPRQRMLSGGNNRPARGGVGFHFESFATTSCPAWMAVSAIV